MPWEKINREVRALRGIEVEEQEHELEHEQEQEEEEEEEEEEEQGGLVKSNVSVAQEGLGAEDSRFTLRCI